MQIVSLPRGDSAKVAIYSSAEIQYCGEAGPAPGAAPRGAAPRANG